WLETGAAPARPDAHQDNVEQIVARYAAGRSIRPGTTIEELGLSSLERVEMMVALEEKLDRPLDEGAFAAAATVGELQRLASMPSEGRSPAEPVDFPRWNRSWPVRVVRTVSQTIFLLPLAQVFAWIHTRGLEHVKDLRGPVIFAANHQSHMDTPVILAALP